MATVSGGGSLTFGGGALRRRAAWRARLTPAHTLVVTAGLVGALASVHVIRTADTTVPVVIVGREVVAGTALHVGDLEVARVHADKAVLATLVRGSDLGSLVGRVADRQLHVGTLLRRDDVAQAGTAPRVRAMSIELDGADAVAGALRVGDRVDVVATSRDAGDAHYVLADAAVLAVQDANASGALRSGSGAFVVTLAIDADHALALAAARAAGDVTLVRSTGAAPIERSSR